MSSLEAIQQAFANAILADTPSREDLSPFRGDAERARARLGLYRGNQRETAIKVLRSAYPVVLALVGDDFFEGLCLAYRREHRSRDADLNRYGDAFADFLADFSPVAPYRYLPDVARLEWLCHRAYYAADDAALTTADLQGLALPRIVAMPVTLCACVQPFASSWAAIPIWLAHQPGDAPPLPGQLDVPCHGVVIRPAWRVGVVPVPEAEASALGSLRLQPASLGELLAQAARDNDGFDPAQTLSRWLQAGLLRVAPQP